MFFIEESLLLITNSNFTTVSSFTRSNLFARIKEKSVKAVDSPQFDKKKGHFMSIW